MRGQSSIEYLTTYGWMLLAVSVAAGVTFTQVQPDCSFDVRGASTSQDITIEQVGAVQGTDVKMVVQSQAYEDIKINSIDLESSYDSATVLPPKVLNPGESATLDLGKVIPSPSCETLDLSINYDKGPLKDR